MEIKNPRRVLFLGGPDSGVLALLKSLTGSAPTPRSLLTAPPSPTASSTPPASASPPISPSPSLLPPTTTTAGLTHTLPLKNAYYTTTLPLWLDEPPSTISTWKADFLTKEAREVVTAVGAWVVVFREGRGGGGRGGDGRGWGRREVGEAMAAVKEIVGFAYGGVEGWDGVCLVVGVGEKELDEDEDEEWEELCWDLGFEYIRCADLKGAQGQEGGERNANRETKGVARVKEALEANDWNGGDGDDDTEALEDALLEEWEDGEVLGEDGEDVGFTMERREMESEFRGLQFAMAADGSGDGGDGDGEEEEALQVEELERMMRKMVAVRDMSAHMPEGEKKRFAARAVNDLLTTM